MVILREDTSLKAIIEKGADNLGDIPLQEFLAYAKNVCLKVAADNLAEKEIGWRKHWLDAAASLQEAEEHIESALTSTKEV
ncbi:hypothetical protein UFOVP1290_184 [uncultured Caudovirales phage]|uniref:Uncharacterized protein n=1 Tax=uncultured Caudovirales phage TaxID=2100421 RepID=A0A6J5RXC8_9CAUD|nr:hypothetical protein UFOVP1290_184 [uncultured Caudovirales phage]